MKYTNPKFNNGDIISIYRKNESNVESWSVDFRVVGFYAPSNYIQLESVNPHKLKTNPYSKPKYIKLNYHIEKLNELYEDGKVNIIHKENNKNLENYEIY